MLTTGKGVLPSPTTSSERKACPWIFSDDWYMKSLSKDIIRVLAIFRGEIHLAISSSNLYRTSLPVGAVNHIDCNGHESTFVMGDFSIN